MGIIYGTVITSGILDKMSVIPKDNIRAEIQANKASQADGVVEMCVCVWISERVTEFPSPISPMY